ncbi:TetR/AcrR family transcriptional regulator [Actinomadura litoris]|uniref:TetR/AcrR family transcriptional regulator n=1 Tax=Actinomadura litoris TaxID=2678616 RepID=UPI001FA7D1D2|nr:TetR/AcrR family transcriptional regulator [Actinomadura litoris]
MHAAVGAIAESGPATWSLRELARRAGVSHAAPAHHFGDKTGLLTAVAAEGYTLFADALERAGEDLYDVGLAYVRFAVDHRAHFEVMFRPELYRADDPEVNAARRRADEILRHGVRAVTPAAAPGETHRPDEAHKAGEAGVDDDRTAALAAWCIVHGFAELWLSGAFSDDLGEDPVAAASPVIRRLFAR